MNNSNQARTNAITWDQAFMSMALIIKERSKDPSTQVGACIVAPDNRILSVGYNGTPNGFDDESFPWGKDDDDPLNTKRPYVIHAERNAVLNFKGQLRDFEGSTMYVTHYPCNECAKEVAQLGIARIVYLEYKENGGSSTAATRIFEVLNIKVDQYRAEVTSIPFPKPVTVVTEVTSFKVNPLLLRPAPPEGADIQIRGDLDCEESVDLLNTESISQMQDKVRDVLTVAETYSDNPLDLHALLPDLSTYDDSEISFHIGDIRGIITDFYPKAHSTPAYVIFALPELFPEGIQFLLNGHRNEETGETEWESLSQTSIIY